LPPSRRTEHTCKHAQHMRILARTHTHTHTHTHTTRTRKRRVPWARRRGDPRGVDIVRAFRVADYNAGHKSFCAHGSSRCSVVTVRGTSLRNRKLGRRHDSVVVCDGAAGGCGHRGPRARDPEGEAAAGSARQGRARRHPQSRGRRCAAGGRADARRGGALAVRRDARRSGAVTGASRRAAAWGGQGAGPCVHGGRGQGTFSTRC
jgi:hypothetical protein